MAGIYSTLMVPNLARDPEQRLQELCNAIKLVYASAFYRNAKAYLASTGNRVEEEKMASATNVIRWKSGTRWPEGATLGFVKRDGTKLDIELEPIFRFQMMGIGYQHPEWGHAVWRDELEIGYENWKLDEVEPDEYCSIHVHNVVRAKMGELEGIGILETIVFGRHEPSGFQDLFDGAP